MADYVEESFHDEYAEQSARPLVEAHPEPTPTPAGTSVAMATATGRRRSGERRAFLVWPQDRAQRVRIRVNPSTSSLWSR
jgi:hypothetical protein